MRFLNIGQCCMARKGSRSSSSSSSSKAQSCNSQLSSKGASSKRQQQHHRRKASLTTLPLQPAAARHAKFGKQALLYSDELGPIQNAIAILLPCLTQGVNFLGHVAQSNESAFFCLLRAAFLKKRL